MKFDHSRPIYEQIVEEFKKKLIRKDLKPGGKIPSQRELAQQIKVNPNTVQRAYREMELEGITHTLRGKGTFIIKDDEMVRRFKKEMADKAFQDFVKEIEALGYKKVDIPSLVQEYLIHEQSNKNSQTG